MKKKEKKSKIEDRLKRFDNIFGKIAVDRVPMDEDKKGARYRDT